MLFSAMDPVLDAINNGTQFRDTVASILRILAWVQGVISIVLFVVLIAIEIPNVEGIGVVSLVFVALCWASAAYSCACITMYRSRSIEAVPDTSRMTSWVLNYLLRMAAEATAAFCFFFGFAALLSSVTDTNSTSLWTGFRMLGVDRLGIWSGLASMLASWFAGSILFVAFTIAAEHMAAAIETAELLRTIRTSSNSQPRVTVATKEARLYPCHHCGSFMPLNARVCEKCGRSLAG